MLQPTQVLEQNQTVLSTLQKIPVLGLPPIAKIVDPQTENAKIFNPYKNK